VTGASDESADSLAVPLPALPVAGRLGRVRAALAVAGTEEARPEALVVTTAANIRWLTGFSGSAGVLVVAADRALLTTDGRYRTQAAEQLAASGGADEVELCIGGVAAQREALAGAASAAASVGLEAGDVTWAAVRTWEELLAPRPLVATQGIVEGLRMVKDPGEIARIERAAAIADAALAAVLPLLHGAADGSGLTESAFAAALDHAMRTHGAEDRAFETIVASGENSAKPHARPGTRVIRAGDPVVVDFGASFDGYRSDMTRTFCVGGAPVGELAEVFAVVAEAQRAGVAAVAPGVVTGDVDKACRDRIAVAGWAERFEHGTGHGVGLDIHEGPAVGAGSTAIL
jgi:Xaa-Pro aminopeptidase